MRLKFTHHAQYRLEERNISATQIRETINKPDAREAAHNGAIKCSKKFSVKTLVVIYAKHQDAFVIMTLYYI